MNKPEISIIIPAYNEEGRIGSTLQKMTAYFSKLGKSYEIIIVNDGSRDQTEQVIVNAQPPLTRIVSYGQNRGKGFAVQFGAKQAAGEWILFADADNSTPIEEFGKLFAETGKYDVIIGSRYVRGSHIALKQGVSRIILSRIGNLLVQLLILPGIQDTQCGFKLFSRSSAKNIFSRQTIHGWGFDMELLKIARDNCYRIKEVPITWYNNDQSRIQSSRVFTKTLKELLVIFGNSLDGLYRPTKRSESGYLMRFGAVGAIGTLLDFAVLNVLVSGLGVNLYLAVTLGFIVGAINNYVLNSFWSFNQPLAWAKFSSFLMVALIGLLISNALVYILSEQWGWHYNIAKIVAVILVFFCNYFLNRRTTFRFNP